MHRALSVSQQIFSSFEVSDADEQSKYSGSASLRGLAHFFVRYLSRQSARAIGYPAALREQRPNGSFFYPQVTSSGWDQQFMSPCKHVKSPRSGKWKELWTMWVHDVFVRDVLNYVSKIRLRPWWWWWWEGWFPMPLNWNITEVMELSAHVWWKSRGGSHRKKK